MTPESLQTRRKTADSSYQTGAIDGLFRRFDVTIREAGCIAMSGQIVDSSLVAAPMGLMIGTIGLARAQTKIGMANLAYNLRRLVQLRGCVIA